MKRIHLLKSFYNMAKKKTLFKILDKNGFEMPKHYSGRNRTEEEAKKILNRLNKNGEYSPYTMIKE